MFITSNNTVEQNWLKNSNRSTRHMLISHTLYKSLCKSKQASATHLMKAAWHFQSPIKFLRHINHTIGHLGIGNRDRGGRGNHDRVTVTEVTMTKLAKVTVTEVADVIMTK